MNKLRINYLNNNDLLHEIHKSKASYCYFVNEEDQSYDAIIDNLESLTAENINLILEKRNAQLRAEAKKMKRTTCQVLVIENLVFRIMTDDHIPIGKDSKKLKCLFAPFKHYRYDNTGELKEVGRSHWVGGFSNGYFSQDQGKMTNKLALMFMKLVERYGQKSNWRGYCVDEETEALTQRGWLGIDEITENDKILSYFEGDMTWSNIKSIFRSDFVGDMHYLTMRGLDMLVTPNHKLVTDRGLIPVELLKQTDHLILMGNPVKDDGVKNHSDNFVELMGWIFTEGCYEFNKGTKNIKSITIYQNPGFKADRIRNCLNGLEYKFTERLRKGNIAFRIWKESSEQITKYFPEKNLNMEFILSLTLDQREKLIDTMIDGDGWRRQEKKHRSYVQKNKEHIDLFQILCAISGHRTMTSERIHSSFGKQSHFYNVNLYSQSKNTTLVGCIDFHGGMDNGRSNPGRGKEYHPNIPNTYYNGKVWCPETEYGCFVARRNNSIYLTGNTYNDEMRNQALLQLTQVGLQFNEARSDNPFAYYTRITQNAFTRILNLEKKVQKLRDDMLIAYGAMPSFTRQVDDAMNQKEVTTE